MRASQKNGRIELSMYRFETAIEGSATWDSRSGWPSDVTAFQGHIARQRYNLARAINIDVLDAESLRAESDRNYAHAHYDAILAALRLRRAIGGF